jgi:hypothetical protein
LCSFFFGAFVAAGCDEPGTSTAALLVISDSAGVELVSSQAPQWTDDTRYRISTRPDISIGGLDDDPLTSFGRVPDATRLSDGRVVVLEAQAQELRVFDPSGAPVTTWGGPGEGPGEFSRPRSLFRLPGDTVVVFDRGARRVTSFDSQGGVIRTATTTAPFRPNLPEEMMAQSCCVPLGVDSKSRIYWRHPEVWLTGGTGRRPSTIRVVRFDADGSGLDTLGQFDSGTTAPWDGPNRVGRINFTTRFEGQIAEGSLIEANGSFYGYRVHDVDQRRLVRIVRAAKARRPVTATWLAGWKELEAARMGGGRESNAERVRQILDRERADSLPSFGQLLVDPTGTVWLTSWTHPSSPDDSTPAAEVFDPQGAWLGSIELPVDLWVLEIGSDYLLGVRQGEFDEPYVEIHRIDRRE